MPPIVTLTTDFGLRDSFVGAMKGVILSRCPEAQVVDICHEVAPQDIRTGALRLAAAAPYFPPGAVHVAVVDPGVGGARRAIAIACGGHRFVGPDNGLLTLAAPRSAARWRAVHLNRPSYWLPSVSDTFHGRDVFAPVAAYLAAGGGLDAVGDRIQDVVELRLEEPDRDGPTLRAKVVDVDRFGNLVTNLRRSDIGGAALARLEVAGQNISGISTTYDPGRPLVAVFNSEGRLEIAAPGGSAAQLLGLSIDEPVTVELAVP